MSSAPHTSPPTDGQADALLNLIEQLRHVTERFAVIDNIDDLALLVHDLVAQTVSVPYYGLYLIDPHSGAFHLKIANGFTEEERLEAERTAMDRHPGWVFRNQKVLHVPDVQQDPQQQTRSSKRSFSIGSRLWIPVMSRSECVGAIGMADKHPHAFSDVHIALLNFMSNLIGVVYRNLTSTAALRHALERAEAADRSKTAFLANMSHELRTPMNGVLGSASLLNTTRLDRQQQELLSTIQTSSHTMVALVDDLLETSKLESGQVELNIDDIDLVTWLDSTVDILLPSILEHRLNLSVRLMRDAPRQLRIDPLRARQILLNLLTNAVKFTEFGLVTIRVDGVDPQTVSIEVEDTGIGIAKDQTHSLFARFSQVDESISRRFGGTGLGLAISRQLAEAMGGHLTLKWSQPGKGSCFALLLPCSSPKPLPPPTDAPIHLNIADPTIAADLQAALQWLGCSQTTAITPATLCISDQPVEGAKRHLRVGDDRDADILPPLRIGRLVDALKGPTTQPEKPSPTPTPQREHVLVVDDNLINRKVALRLLANQGYTVSEAADAQSAQQQIEQGGIDLVLLDVHMPGEDGISLTRRLRRGESGRWGKVVPIVACTADLLPQTTTRCLEVGMLDVVPKPIRHEHLSRTLRRAAEAGRRVLIVDDVATNQLVLRSMLRRHHLTVDEASSGEEALDKLAHSAYRFIIMDEHLGDLTGREIVTALRAMNVPWRTIPVISSSGTVSMHAPQHTYDDNLPKPVELHQVNQLIERWGPWMRGPHEQ